MSNDAIPYIQLATIIINVILAFVAVFGEKIRNSFYKPNLHLSITTLFPDCNLTTFLDGTRAFIFRIAITNNGNVDAYNVQIHLNNIQKKGLDGKFTPCNHVLPMNLLWSYQDNEPKKTTIAYSISPKMKKYCDFIFTLENTNNCLLCTEVALTSYGVPTNWIDKGTYRADIIILASNSKAKKYNIEFEYTGFWSNDAEDVMSFSILKEQV